MLRPRIIPCLLIHDGGLVKTTRFGSPKYVGDPLNAVRIFNEKETDEIIVLDIDASTRSVEPNLTVIAQLASECRMPLCYGGGVRSVELASRIISLGVEKVSLSSAFFSDPLLIRRIADQVGSQSVVVTLDVKRNPSTGRYEVWTHNATRNTSVEAAGAAAKAQDLGAGEIVVNSVDNDGVMRGYDLDLAALARRTVGIPLTIMGGAGSLDDIARLIGACGVIGAAAGSLFVFKGTFRAVLINYPNQAQKDAVCDAALSVGGAPSSKPHDRRE